MPQTEFVEPIRLSTYKHRILGAILLVSLAVIFIPVFLNGTPPTPRIQRSNIPPQPKEPLPLAVNDSTTALAKAKVNLNPTKLPPEVAAPTPAKPVVTPPVKTEPTASHKQWNIQMASFFTEDNAQTLLGQLQQAGFKAYLQTTTVAGNKVFRVYVGPAANRAEAEQLTTRIQRQFHIEGVIREAKAAHHQLVSRG